jgi:hypothetical protein
MENEMLGHMKVGGFVVMCLLLFGKKQPNPSYVLKDLVLEVFPHYGKYNTHDCEEYKNHQINVWFLAVSRMFIIFS